MRLRVRYLSTVGHGKSCRNLGGPPSKAKDVIATDSAEYREGKVKSTPLRGSEIVPETVYLQAVGARKGDSVPFVE